MRQKSGKKSTAHRTGSGPQSGRQSVALSQRHKKISMLEADEEFTLAKDYADSGDKGAAHKLVTSHLRLVAKSPWAIAGTAAYWRGDFRGQCRADARRAKI